MDLHSGAPFWPARAGLPATYPRLTRDAVADVAVVGAGITGALVAHRLSEAGAEVILLDAGDVAAGSTAATSGLLLPDLDVSLSDLSKRMGPTCATRIHALGVEAIEDIADLVRRLDLTCGFSFRPSLYLASRRRDVAALRAECAFRRQYEVDGEFLDAQALAGDYGLDRPAAMLGHVGAEVDCYRLTHGVIARASRRGIGVFARTKVAKLEADHHRVTLTTSAGQRIRALVAIDATGYVAASRAPGVRAHLTSTWVFASEPLAALPGWEHRALIWETARPYLYLRVTDDGRVLAGGEDEPWAERHTNLSSLSGKTQRLLARVRELFPRLDIRPDYRWAGTFAWTDDGLPIIGPMDGQPRVWRAFGFGGNGITCAMIAANLLAARFLGRASPEEAWFASRPRSGRDGSRPCAI